MSGRWWPPPWGRILCHEENDDKTTTKKAKRSSRSSGSSMASASTLFSESGRISFWRPRRSAETTVGCDKDANAADANAATWVLLDGQPASQRLNLVHGARVSSDLMETLERSARTADRLPIDGRLLAVKDDAWAATHPDARCRLSECVATAHDVGVRHHLRGGDRHSHTVEVWRMLLVREPPAARDSTGRRTWLWPVGRVPDFADPERMDLDLACSTALRAGVRWLDLSCTGLRALPDELFGMATLQRLELHGNELRDVPDAIAELTRLDYLALHRNLLEGLPPRFVELAELRWLSLHCNRLAAVPTRELPPGLQRLSLHGNAIEGAIDGPGGARNPSSPSRLVVLSLFKNGIVALPPPSVIASGWTGLTRLGLQCNALAELPDEIGLLAALEDLWVFANRLTRLPETIGALRSLKTLFANDNLLARVPDSIGACTALRELYLANNRLADIPLAAMAWGCRALVKLQVQPGNAPELGAAEGVADWPVGLRRALLQPGVT